MSPDLLRALAALNEVLFIPCLSALSIGFEQTSYTFNETTVLSSEIPIISVNNRITELTFQVRTQVLPGVDNPATPDDDFIPGSELFDFSSDQTLAFDFTILDDIVPEETESFLLMLSLPEEEELHGTVGVEAALASVFIEDDDGKMSPGSVVY